MAKKAYLVVTTLVTRVVVDEDLENKDNWNELVSKVESNITERVNNHEVEENIDDVLEDTECPYGSINGDC